MAWIGAWIGVALVTRRAAAAAIARARPSRAPRRGFRRDRAVRGQGLPGFCVARRDVPRGPGADRPVPPADRARLLRGGARVHEPAALPRAERRHGGNPAVASRRTAPEGRRTMWRFFWLSVLICTPVVAAPRADRGMAAAGRSSAATSRKPSPSRGCCWRAPTSSACAACSPTARAASGGRSSARWPRSPRGSCCCRPWASRPRPGTPSRWRTRCRQRRVLSFIVILVGLLVDLGPLERAAGRIRIPSRERLRRAPGHVGAHRLRAPRGRRRRGPVPPARRAVARPCRPPRAAHWRSSRSGARTRGSGRRGSVTWCPRAPVDDPDLRWSRWLYYAGTATVGFLVLRPGGDFTVSDLIYLLAVAAVIGHYIATVGDPPVLLPRLALVGVVLFCVGGLFTAFYEGSATANISVLVPRRLPRGRLVLARDDRADAVGAHRITMAWWVLSAGVASAAAIVQFTLGDVIPGASIHYGRVSGLTDHVNDLGGLAGCTLVPALALLHRGMRASRAERVTALVSLPLIAPASSCRAPSAASLAAMASGAIWVVATRTVIRGVAVLALCSGHLRPSPHRAPARLPSPMQRFTMSTAESGSENATFWTRVDTYEAAWRGRPRPSALRRRVAPGGHADRDRAPGAQQPHEAAVRGRRRSRRWA